MILEKRSDAGATELLYQTNKFVKTEKRPIGPWEPIKFSLTPVSAASCQTKATNDRSTDTCRG